MIDFIPAGDNTRKTWATNFKDKLTKQPRQTNPPMRTRLSKRFGAASAGFWLVVLFSFFPGKSSFAAPTPSPTPTPFKMIIASDPQFDWYEDDGATGNGHPICASGTPNCDEHQISINDNTLQSNEIQHLAKKDPDIKGFIMNGDLTAYGRAKGKNSQLADFKKYYDGIGVTLYPGLGNHDYENNIRSIDDTKDPSSKPQGCYNNDCAVDMINYLSDYVKKTLKLTATFDAQNTSTKKGHTTYTSSLAYSWEIGNVHFVQLNNYPQYTVTFHHYPSASEAIYHVFEIESAQAWLEKDLDTAHQNKKHIILNYHDPTQPNPATGWLGQMIEKYEVSAIFCGHLHEYCQLYSNYTYTYTDGTTRNVPIFVSGSSLYGTFLLATFDEHHMTVDTVKRQGPLTALVSKTVPTNLSYVRSAITSPDPGAPTPTPGATSTASPTPYKFPLY